MCSSTANDNDSIDFDFFEAEEGLIQRYRTKSQRDCSKIVTKAVIETNPSKPVLDFKQNIGHGNKIKKQSHLTKEMPIHFDCLSSPTSSVENKFLEDINVKGPLLNCLAYNSSSYDIQDSSYILLDQDCSNNSSSDSTITTITSDFTSISSLFSISDSSCISSACDDPSIPQNKIEEAYENRPSSNETDGGEQTNFSEVNSKCINDLHEDANFNTGFECGNDLCTPETEVNDDYLLIHEEKESDRYSNDNQPTNEIDWDEQCLIDEDNNGNQSIQHMEENYRCTNNDNGDDTSLRESYVFETNEVHTNSDSEIDEDMLNESKHAVFDCKRTTQRNNSSCNSQSEIVNGSECNSLHERESNLSVGLLEEEIGDISLTSQLSSKLSSQKSLLCRGSSKLRTKKKEYNLSFNRDEVIKIERDNLVLLKKIMAHSKPRTVSLNQSFYNKKTSTAINRARQQKKIDQDNYILYSKISALGRIKKVF